MVVLRSLWFISQSDSACQLLPQLLSSRPGCRPAHSTRMPADRQRRAGIKVVCRAVSS